MRASQTPCEAVEDAPVELARHQQTPSVPIIRFDRKGSRLARTRLREVGDRRRAIADDRLERREVLHLGRDDLEQEVVTERPRRGRSAQPRTKPRATGGGQPDGRRVFTRIAHVRVVGTRSKLCVIPVGFRADGDCDRAQETLAPKRVDHRVEALPASERMSAPELAHERGSTQRLVRHLAEHRLLHAHPVAPDRWQTRLQDLLGETYWCGRTGALVATSRFTSTRHAGIPVATRYSVFWG
ncbi:MAG TPA: hypothetical protein VFS37_08295 [Conexibacter sp.]|nr:hypothetical protein [Conexibacter sp.]